MQDIHSAHPDKNESPPLRGFAVQNIQENIGRIKSLLLDLNDLRAGLRPQVSRLETTLAGGIFLWDHINDSLINDLAKVAALEKEILEKYQELKFGDPPENIATMAETLEKQEKLIAQKAAYMDAVNFFMTLRAEDPATEACLNQHKEQLALYDFSQISFEECENALEKYILLKKALEEPDPKAKFSLLMQMNGLFELQIIYDININGIISIAPASSEAAAMEETVVAASFASDPQPQTGLSPNPDMPATPDFGTGFDTQATPDSGSGPDSVTQATQTPPHSGSVTQATQTPPDSDLDSDSGAQARSDTAPDIQVSSSPDFAGQPSPDSASSPLPYPVSPDAGAAASGSSLDAEDEDEEVTWESLGIQDVDTITIHMDDSQLTCQESAKTKKFGVKNFKSDLFKIGNPAAKLVLASARKYNGVTAELLFTVYGGKKSFYTSACDRLTQMGYLKKYNLLGHGHFFVLSSKGFRIFKTKESASFLGCRQIPENPDYQFIEDNSNSAMVRIMLFRTFSLLRVLDPDYHFGSFATYLGTDGYVIRFAHVFPEESVVGFVCLISDCVEEFDSLKAAFQDNIEKLDIIAVTGLNRNHAKALSSWLYTSFSHELSEKRLWYLDYDTETFYNYDDDSVISFETSDEAEESDDPKSPENGGADAASALASPTAATAEVTCAVPGDANVPGSADTLSAADLGALDNCGAVDLGAPGTLSPTDPGAPDSPNAASPDSPDTSHTADPSTVNPSTLNTRGPTAEAAANPSTAAPNTPVTANPGTLDTPAAANPGTLDGPAAAPSGAPDALNALNTAPADSAPGKVLTDSQRAHFRDMIFQMLSEGRHYCAAAYLRSLSEKYPDYVLPYTQLAYALNDPLAQCSYSSHRIFQIYYGKSGPDNDYYLLSAVLRNYFLDHTSYDYTLQQLQGSIASVGLLEDNPCLNQILYTLQTFKSTYHRGMDFYADYRQKKREAFEKNLASVLSEAAELYDNNTGGIIKENASHRRVLETKKLIFAKDSDLVVCLEAVKDDNRDYLSIIKDFLTANYIKDGADVTADNIDPSKIDRVLDTNWELAAGNMRLVKRSSDLMSSLRMNLFKLVKKVVVVLCNYVSALEDNSIDENDPAFISYRRTRDKLLKNIRDAVSHFKKNPPSSAKDRAGQAVLGAALTELAARLEGTYDEDSSQYFYLGFLKNDKVLLDDDYLPVLDDVNEIPELSVLSRIEDHFSSPERDLESRLVEIFKGGDDYGSAALILQVLRKYPGTVKNRELLDSSIENALLYPRKDMENKRREFIEDLELAQSYGQIDNTTEDRKEALIQIMNFWYEWAMETDNYGFFYKILASIRKKIKNDAQVRGVDLMASLSSYQKENPGWADSDLVSDAVAQIRSRIDSQNYAAAEDLLNRLIANDLDSDFNFIQHDYLDEFLREYALNSSQAGTARATLQSRLLKGHNKDARGAGRLVENWPKGSGTPALKIQNLLMALGFAVENVTVHAPIQGKDHYQVTLKRPVNGRKSNYKHPISVFGSEAEEKGFRVVNIFGKMDAGRLIDTFKEIGTAKNTLILLDHTLTLPDRRELARKTKTEFSAKTFLVIDRVVLVYLANHYSETAVNRMLMAVTIPFAACQPYVPDSAKIMPPEIFMGRKHELEKIESASGVNIVYGGRQLGKSALLRMACSDINMDENGDRAILVDLKGLDYRAAARKISGALYDEGILKTEHITEDWDELSRDVKNRLRDTSGPDHIPYLLLLMDEADVFIESCEAVDYRPFDSLKDIQSVGAGRFKFVVAGLRNIVRFKKNTALSNNRVLTHLSSLTVTPFKSTEARELLEIPLFYLGFRFPDDSKTQMLISTIFGTTNYFPGLLQLYCAKLVEAMRRDYAGYSETETPPYIVREEHIKKALSDKTLEEQIREKFFITLKYGDDDYYYLIALLTAYNYHNNKGQNGCGAADILSTADGYGITRISSLTKEKVAALMEEMRELNVLQYAGDGRYRFARHNFCQMMGSMQKIDDEILDYADR